MALTFVTFQAGGNTNGGSSSVASNVSGNPGTTFNLTAGNSMLVGVLSNGAATITGIADTAGNSFGSAVASQAISGGGTIYWYIVNNCLGNAANVVTATLSSGSQTYNVIAVWQISGGTLTYDTDASGTGTSTSVSTSSFNTQYANEVVVSIGWQVSGSALLTAASGYTRDNSAVAGGYLNGEHQIFTSTQSGITAGWSNGSSIQMDVFAIAAGIAVSTYSISGNAGVAGATVSYTGTSSGSTTADGSGNYTISSLANGSYTITPSKTGYSFSPTSANETVSGSNITSVNFTATQLQVATSTISIVSGTATVSNADSGYSGFAQYYTTDGSTPTTGSTQYSTPVTLTLGQTIKVLAVATGYANSNIASATYQNHYSVPDCRNYGNFPNTAVVTNGTSTYTGQTSSNPNIPGTDSRAAGVPQDCRQSGNIPQNSRTPGTYGPGE